MVLQRVDIFFYTQTPALQGWFTLIISGGTLHRGKVCSFPFNFFGRLGHVFFSPDLQFIISRI
jgi:hypothetical protein